MQPKESTIETSDEVYVWRGTSIEQLCEHIVNIVLVGCYLMFFMEQRRALEHGMRWDVVLFSAKITLEMFLFLIRRIPRTTAASPRAWAVTFFAVFSVMMLRPEDNRGWMAVGIPLMQIGLTFHVLTLLSLGRSFGIIPANRGVRRGGTYRLVRHPLYFSIVITLTGYLICNPSLYNVVAFVIGIGLHLLRIREEERVLGLDQGYREYSARVRWRLIPFLY